MPQRIAADPHGFPGRWNCQGFHPHDLIRIGHAPTAGVQVTKPLSPPDSRKPRRRAVAATQPALTNSCLLDLCETASLAQAVAARACGTTHLSTTCGDTPNT